MGCGCKNKEIIDSNDQEIINYQNQEIKQEESCTTCKKGFEERAQNFLLRENKFSIIGIFLFLLLTPVFITIFLPVIVIILFNKLIFGKNTDPIKLLIFTKNKKRKK